MNRNITTKRIAIAAIALAASVQGARASDLSLWGVIPGGTSFSGSSVANWTPGNTTNLNNSSGVTTGTFAGGIGTYSNISYSIWDNYGPRGGAISNNGGQAFDVKAMYASTDATYEHVAIITGSNPNGFTFEGHPYAPGDLAIDPKITGNTADYGLKTATAAATTTGDSGTGLKLYSGGTWSNPGINGYTSTPPYTVLSGGTQVANDDTYTYTDLGISYANPGIGGTQEVYLLEFNILKSELGTDANNTLTFGFGPTCGNDYMTVSLADLPSTGGGVPEPASLSILGLAGAGLILRRRRTR